jgi:hypothetical protein
LLIDFEDVQSHRCLAFADSVSHCKQSDANAEPAARKKTGSHAGLRANPFLIELAAINVSPR